MLGAQLRASALAVSVSVVAGLCARRGLLGHSADLMVGRKSSLLIHGMPPKALIVVPSVSMPRKSWSISFTPYPVSVPVEPVRVRRNDCETPVGNLSAVKIGRVRRNTDSRVGRVAILSFPVCRLRLDYLVKGRCGCVACGVAGHPRDYQSQHNRDHQRHGGVYLENRFGNYILD